jgi:hypothetical protein
MNDLQQAILTIAEGWGKRGCVETVPNGGGCIDEVHRLFDPAHPVRDAYCAEFAWVVVDQACRSIGIQNILPHERGARSLLVKAKAIPDLRVDRQPALGAVMYRRSTVKTASGHMAIVYRIDDPKVLWTVDGNRGPRIAFNSTSWAAVQAAANDVWFIHIEETGPANSDSNSGLTSLAWVVASTAAAYLTAKLLS